jgi:hypothetical protein
MSYDFYESGLGRYHEVNFCLSALFLLESIGSLVAVGRILIL